MLFGVFFLCQIDTNGHKQGRMIVFLTTSIWFLPDALIGYSIGFMTNP